MRFTSAAMASFLTCARVVGAGGMGDLPAPPREDLVKVLLPGNWADPTIARVDRDYYLTANNDNHVPSVMIFHSRDLRHWKALGYACPATGQGPATDIAAFDGKLYVYGGGGNDAWVCVAEPPYTAWSERINLEPVEPHGIDAGHIADEAGRRYLYLNQGQVVELSGDGLKAQTAPRKVYEGWPIPSDLAIECFCLESPKLFRRGDWYYMVSAQGGTAGPATSHMAVVARAGSALGPWENAPRTPLIWTRDPAEAFWSKGHATLIEGPGEQWYAIYHGYPKGQRSSGRWTLISPITWADDGWPELASVWPPGWDAPIEVDWPLSDEFDGDALGVPWQAHRRLDPDRYEVKGGELVVSALGEEPAESYPLTVNPKHLSYEVETEVELQGDVTAGLILYYSPAAYVSLGLSSAGEVAKHVMKSAAGPRSGYRDRASYPSLTIQLRMVNHLQDATCYYREPGGAWRKLERSDDLSGFQHNLYGGFISVRPGLYANGDGKAVFHYFRYRALKPSAPPPGT